MLKLKKIAMLTVAVATLGTATVGAINAAAATTNPSSWYLDVWQYGTSKGQNYSYYNVTDTRRIGAKASVNNGAGASQSRSSQYGWAKASVNDVWYAVGKSYWDYFWF